MIRLRPRRKPVAEMNVVPYIDVMLVLLVIFMVTAPMLNQGLNVELPQVSSEPIAQDNQARVLTVSITADHDYHWQLDAVNGDAETSPPKTKELQQLVAAVGKIIGHQQSQGLSVQVLVRGDKSVDYGAVMAVMGGLQQAGVENVGLITEAP